MVFSVLPGSDGALLFGRAGNEDAVTVEIAFPDSAGTLTAPVADSGFFGVSIPDAAMRTMMIEIQPGPEVPPTKDGGPTMSFVPERVAAIMVTASNAADVRIASGVPVTVPEAGTGTSGPTPTTAPVP